MSTPLFVCGMYRSGTSLIQTLLTNHRQALVVYQPYHQLYIDVKRRFLDEQSIESLLPLDLGLPGDRAQRELFQKWLDTRWFNAGEVEALALCATTGKGGGLADIHSLSAPEGRFVEVRKALHLAMGDQLGCKEAQVIGSKEILCEEFVPALLAAGERCVLIIRDPRAVVASANNGRYREMVGDRYPLMMQIRLWRKTAAYWMHYRNHPLVRAIRYEDLIAEPDPILQDLAAWLGLDPFPPGLIDGSLHDHAGRPWQGNSSFGDKSTIDSSTRDAWLNLLAPDECRFITACLWQELAAIGYPLHEDLSEHDILNFEENTCGVRASLLAQHAVDDARCEAVERFALAPQSGMGGSGPENHFLFPEDLAHLPARSIGAVPHV